MLLLLRWYSWETFVVSPSRLYLFVLLFCWWLLERVISLLCYYFLPVIFYFSIRLCALEQSCSNRHGVHGLVFIRESAGSPDENMVEKKPRSHHMSSKTVMEVTGVRAGDVFPKTSSVGEILEPCSINKTKTNALCHTPHSRFYAFYSFVFFSFFFNQTFPDLQQANIKPTFPPRPLCPAVISCFDRKRCLL